MKRLLNLYRIFFALVLGAILLIFVYYKYQISPVDKANNNIIAFEIKEGETSTTIGANLKKEKLIRKETFFKIYLKLNSIDNLQAGHYELSQDMSMEEIVTILSEGKATFPDAFTITIKEGKNIKDIVALIADSTIHTEEDQYALLKNENYLDELIETYWFITDEIKNEEIYYSLEGYLFPDTYTLQNKEIALKDIYKMLIDNMASKLEEHKNDIEAHDLTTHEILTLASIVELEGVNEETRADIAEVFYNRLEIGDSLGSDVTTYYAVGISMGDRDLYLAELNDTNAYNTRNGNLPGRLPIGPICSPGLESILGTINPTENDYFYFVADKNKNVYFTKTYNEHLNKVSELKANNLWYTY